MSKVTHVFGLTHSVFGFASKATIASIKFNLLPGLRLSTRLGLTVPTPRELRLMATAIKHADFTPAAYDLFQAAYHADNIFREDTNYLGAAWVAASFQAIGETLAKLLFATADAFELEPTKNFAGYFRAIHTARTEMGTTGLVPSVS